MVRQADTQRQGLGVLGLCQLALRLAEILHGANYAYLFSSDIKSKLVE